MSPHPVQTPSIPPNVAAPSLSRWPPASCCWKSPPSCERPSPVCRARAPSPSWWAAAPKHVHLASDFTVLVSYRLCSGPQDLDSCRLRLDPELGRHRYERKISFAGILDDEDGHDSLNSSSHTLKSDITCDDKKTPEAQGEVGCGASERASSLPRPGAYFCFSFSFFFFFFFYQPFRRSLPAAVLSSARPQDSHRRLQAAADQRCSQFSGEEGGLAVVHPPRRQPQEHQAVAAGLGVGERRGAAVADPEQGHGHRHRQDTRTLVIHSAF